MDKEKAELFALLFLCPFIRKEISVCFDRGPVRHFRHPVEQVGEIFEEVDAVQPAGTRQRIEDASALGAGIYFGALRVTRKLLIIITLSVFRVAKIRKRLRGYVLT